MKIKSQFKDYYDYVQHVYGGGDEKVTYVRKAIGERYDGAAISYYKDITVAVEDFNAPYCPYKFKKPESSNPLNINLRNEHDVDWLVICGKFYPVLDLGMYLQPKWELLDPRRHGSILKNRRGRDWVTGAYYEATPMGVEDEKLVTLSREVGHPAFVVTGWTYDPRAKDKWRVTIAGNCPILTDIPGIAGVYPAEQLYQDLSYFIGNRMKTSPDMMPPTQLTDKEKIQQHGFDVKKSFRHRKD